MTVLARWGTAIGRAGKRVGWWRLAITFAALVLAVLFARYSWTLPLATDAERALYDTRLLITSPRVEEDQRIVMIVYDEETLALTGKRSPLDRVILAKALRNLDAMGARGIGIDILIDQAQPEDAELIAAMRAMKTPVKLAFSSNADTSAFIQPWQESFMRDFQRRVAAGNVHPASIRIEADPDGVMRRWPRRPPGLPPLFANALAPGHAGFDNYSGSLLYRLPVSDDRNVFGKFAIQLFADPTLAEAFRSQIAGRYVLIGGVLSDIDQFDTPITRISKAGETGTTSGLEIQATMLAQVLDGRRPVPLGWPTLWLSAILVVIVGTAVGALDMGPWRTGLALAQSAVLLIAVPLLLQWTGFDTQPLPMFGWIGGWLAAVIVGASAARAVHSNERRFAQGALGKYLPRDVAKAIIANPEQLSLKGEKREIYALFTDMEGFTRLTHQIGPEQVANLLNRYLDTLSKVVLAHGGTLDKFVGDAVVAFWGAPIARPDDADKAISAAIALYEAGEKFRASCPPELGVGRTRVGVHRGEAIVGNLGGEGRIQYTALGDSMNAAARLESANKALKTILLVSREALIESTLICFRAMGRVTVRGRSTPLEVFEAVPGIDPGDTHRLAEAIAAFDRGEAGALDTLRAIAAERPDDAALANLVARLEQVGAGEAMRWTDAGLFVAAIATLGGVAWADTLVVRATGPSAGSYPPGKKLPDNTKIMLKPRDVITLLDDRGTRTLTGPGIFPTTTTTASNKATSVIAVLTSERRDQRIRIGAVRQMEGVTDARPNIWMVDVAKPGPVCVTDPKAVKLWRLDGGKAAQGSLSEVGGKASAQLSWKAGEESMAWPAGLTVTSGARYRVAYGSDPAIEIRVFVVDTNPTDVTAMADALMKNGCATQFDQVVATAAAVSASRS